MTRITDTSNKRQIRRDANRANKEAIPEPTPKRKKRKRDKK